jgi:hypothetical protein
MVLSRNILKRNIYPIDRIKNQLRDAGAKKGDLVTIGIMAVDENHIASIFACAEMGLRVVILDSPATLESLPYTKLALHGPSDFHVYDSNENTKGIYGGLHDEMMSRYGGKAVDVRQDGSDEYFHVDVSPTDPFLLSSTSGTTKPSRPILFSHKEVYEISKRNIGIFGFTEDSRVVQSRNLHHASAMLTSLLPSLMVTDIHMNFSIGHDNSHEENASYIKGLHGVYHLGSTHIMIPNKRELYDFLDSFPIPFKRTLNINMCGFALTEEFVELAKEYNVCFQSHYGSIDTAIPLLINRVDKDSVVVPNSLGVLCDDFYKTTLENGRMKVEHPFWDAPRYMDDHIEMVEDQYVLMGSRTVDIDIPEGFDLTPFSQDTKINYEQLRGHLHTFSP